MQTLDFYKQAFNTNILLNFDENECTLDWYKFKSTNLKKKLPNIVIHINVLDEHNISTLISFIEELNEKVVVEKILIVANILNNIVPTYIYKNGKTLLLKTKTKEYTALNTEISYFN